MPINYGTDTVEDFGVEVEEGDIEVQEEVDTEGLEHTESEGDTKPKLTLPDVPTNYAEIANIWESFCTKIATLEGWGSKGLINSSNMLKLHLRLAAQHLIDVRRHLDSVNGEVRPRTGIVDTSKYGRKRTFTSFFTKLSDASLAAQCKLFQVKPVDEGRPREVVIEELVKFAMEVE